MIQAGQNFGQPGRTGLFLERDIDAGGVETGTAAAEVSAAFPCLPGRYPEGIYFSVRDVELEAHGFAGVFLQASGAFPAYHCFGGVDVLEHDAFVLGESGHGIAFGIEKLDCNSFRLRIDEEILAVEAQFAGGKCAFAIHALHGNEAVAPQYAESGLTP